MSLRNAVIGIVPIVVCSGYVEYELTRSTRGYFKEQYLMRKLVH